MKEQTSERILVVDDEEPVRDMTLAYVLMMGYSCDAVSSAEEAMERLQREYFDMVVSDITMKGMDGLEFMEKAKETFPQLGFVIMTAYTSEYSYTDIIKAGAVDYLAKPFEQAELEARLQRAIRERRLFRQLKESEKRYKALFQCAAEGILVADIETKKFKYANEAICTMLGYTEEELERMSVADIHPKEALEHVISEFEAQARGEKTLAPSIPCLRKDGTTIYADINTAKVFIGEAECNVGFFTDITERKRREDALQKSHDELEKTLRQLKMTQSRMLQSEKMASIGQLAAGIAHEINNPTGFVSSNLYSLGRYYKDINELIGEYRSLISGLGEAMAAGQVGACVSEKLNRIAALEKETDIDFILDDTPNLIKESAEGADRIKKIVNDLKNFAHPGEDKPKLADINHGLESTLNVVWNVLKYKAKVIKEYGEVPQVMCYPQELNQVFMNLLVNAGHAIEKGGEIKIVTRALDGKVQIEISDTGVGIPVENLSGIFDLFFTTKEVGKGTGLGLNVAYNIIKKHKGTIDVESQVGEGTTFIISIPLNTNDQ